MKLAGSATRGAAAKARQEAAGERGKEGGRGHKRPDENLGANNSPKVSDAGRKKGAEATAAKARGDGERLAAEKSRKPSDTGYVNTQLAGTSTGRWRHLTRRRGYGRGVRHPHF